MTELTVGLIGGTGPEGRGLARRWANTGARVLVGSRSAERAKLVCDEIADALGLKNLHPVENKNAIVESDLVILAIPFEHAVSTLEAHKGDLGPGSVLIDTTVPVSFEGGRARYIELPEGSGSEHLRARLGDRIPIVAAFKTIPAHLLESGDPLDCDDFIAGDSKEAKSRVIEAMASIESLRPIDAGALENARTIERMTVLAIGINRRYKTKTGRYRFVGI